MKVLVVDDVELNRELLTDILNEAGMEAVTAKDGLDALEVLKEEWGNIQAILLDLMMPRMDGMTLLRRLKQEKVMCEIPVIVISAQDEFHAEIQSLELGASDFIHKPFIRQVVAQRVKNACQLFLHKNSLVKLVEQQTKELREYALRIRKNNERIIDILGTVVEYRNLESGMHIFRVKELTSILAQNMMRLYPQTGLTEERIALITEASPLHDIGKITIPDSILLKPGRLSPEEFEAMKAHTVNGAKMLQRIDGAWDADYAQACYEICLYHHERYDGRGYPDGLRGEEIPLSAQLVSVADVYDALVSRRVYKEPYGLEESYQMILEGQCGVFSPRLMECLRCAKAAFEAVVLSRCEDETPTQMASAGR